MPASPSPQSHAPRSSSPLLVVGVQGIEAVDLVVRGPVGGRVAKDHQRFELGQRLQRLFALISVVHPESGWAVAADHIDRLARLEIVPVVLDARLSFPVALKPGY